MKTQAEAIESITANDKSDSLPNFAQNTSIKTTKKLRFTGMLSGGDRIQDRLPLLKLKDSINAHNSTAK